MIIEPTHQFIYDNNETYNTNYMVWSQLNHEERLAWGDEPLTADQQKETFSKMFQDKA